MSRRNPRDRRVKMLRLWLRGLRKMSRRIEDARKKELRTGELRMWRLVMGIRKGTIL